MDYLIDQAIYENINKDSYDIIGPCKENKQIIWTNSTLENIFNAHNLYKKSKANKIIQICKNVFCINPIHLREVSYEIWFKKGLDAELLWMDYV